jgi:hypothetical protein
MKFIVASIFTIFLCLPSNGQTADTIRIYDYLKPFDSWRLTVENNMVFSLATDSQFGKDSIGFIGSCKINNSRIQFLWDSTFSTNKNFANEKLKIFSNIPYILLGDVFTFENNYLIPRNIVYEPDDSIKIPEGVFARYIRGDGFSNVIIELKLNNTYEIIDHSCTARFIEYGNWSSKGSIIKLFPLNRKKSMIDWFTDNKKLYVSERHLIGKKIYRCINDSRRIVVTETYYFMSKQPEYLTQ